MRATSQRIGIVTAGLCLAVGLAACGSDNGADDPSNGDPTPSPEADSPDSGPEPDPAPEGLVGGSGTGYTIEVTDDWVELDLQAEDLAQAAEDAGFTENPELARDAAGQLGNLPGAFFVFDMGREHDEFVTNVNGYCVPNQGVSDLQQLAAASEQELGTVGAVDVDIVETTIGEATAIQTSYTLPLAELTLVGLQYGFLDDNDQLCYLTFTTTEDDDDIDRFVQIADTLRLA